MIKRILLFTSTTFCIAAQAGTTRDLSLRAYVPPTSRTSLRERSMSTSQRLWIISNETNVEHAAESQKFELEGLTQPGLEAHISKVISHNRTIQYEILINRISNTLLIQHPIVMNISAN
jgi:hypothetical protein